MTRLNRVEYLSQVIASGDEVHDVASSAAHPVVVSRQDIDCNSLAVDDLHRNFRTVLFKATGFIDLFFHCANLRSTIRKPRCCSKRHYVQPLWKVIVKNRGSLELKGAF